MGRGLYDAMLEATTTRMSARALRISVWDNCPEGRAFADRRGFVEKRHQFAMALDLSAFDDAPYDAHDREAEGRGVPVHVDGGAGEHGRGPAQPLRPE